MTTLKQMKMTKVIDNIIKEFREKYCKHDEDEIIHIKSGVQLEIEQFIKEALERVYNQGFVDGAIEIEERQKLNKN